MDFIENEVFKQLVYNPNFKDYIFVITNKFVRIYTIKSLEMLNIKNVAGGPMLKK